MYCKTNTLSVFSVDFPLQALVQSFTDLTDVEYERYFSYAAVWAFGGTLDVEYRESFSSWWRTQFDQHIDYPEDGTVSYACVCVCVCVGSGGW